MFVESRNAGAVVLARVKFANVVRRFASRSHPVIGAVTIESVNFVYADAIIEAG